MLLSEEEKSMYAGHQKQQMSFYIVEQGVHNAIQVGARAGGGEKSHKARMSDERGGLGWHQ